MSFGCNESSINSAFEIFKKEGENSTTRYWIQGDKRFVSFISVPEKDTVRGLSVYELGHRLDASFLRITFIFLFCKS